MYGQLAKSPTQLTKSLSLTTLFSTSSSTTVKNRTSMRKPEFNETPNQ